MVQKEHAIAYTSDEPPGQLPGETQVTKSIKINPINLLEKLDAASRINLTKLYPVEHNVKVFEVGMVTSDDIRKLRLYYKNALEDELNEIRNRV